MLELKDSTKYTFGVIPLLNQKPKSFFFLFGQAKADVSLRAVNLFIHSIKQFGDCSWYQAKVIDIQVVGDLLTYDLYAKVG